MPDYKHQLVRAFGHLNLIPFGIRDRIVRLFFHPDRMRTTPFEVKFFGYRYRGDLSCFLDWEVYFYGAYERPILSLLDDISVNYSPQLPTFIDIGANVGQHTLFMASRSKRVISIEPLEDVRKYLEHKVKDNQITNVNIQEFALGSKDEYRLFNAPVGNNSGTGSFLKEHNPQNNSRPIEVEVRHGSRLFKSLSVSSPVIIKIDVEGFELEVMQGLQEFISESRPIIIMEFSDLSRQQFGSEKIFLSKLTSEYVIYAIKQTFDNYKLAPFEFDDFEGNVLLVGDKSFASI